MYTDTSVATYASGTYHNMGPRTFWYQFYKQASLPFGVFAVALVLAIARAQGFVPADIAVQVRMAERFGILIAVILGLIAYFVAKIVHRNNTFALTDDALKIRRGVFRKEEFAIPYRQIQNTEIERTLTQRVLGLSTLIILTAAQEHELSRRDEPESIIPSIDRDRAASLQDELLKRSNTQKVSQTNLHAFTTPPGQ
ncbi:MAG: PH domain-containing protein [bacterium]|nr:PH domain-containing protein [bacterium]